ncbi:lipid kinase [Virgifigura deserti]|uniref:lipid kinase n=1 Tax=Virgifigura deserti TaxID=2268457 RepID=UPI003CCC2E89
MSGKRALLLVNAKSRRGKVDFTAALDRLRQDDLELIEAFTRRPREIPEVIRRHRDEIDCIILGGGDGTLNAAAEALLNAGLPLGILPMGTANDFARTLGIPTTLPEACEVIVGGVLHPIDLGVVNGKYFFNVASMGLSVQCARRLTGEVKRRWGVLGYAICTRDALKATRTFSAEVTCDGRTSRFRSIQIAVGNGRHYGGGLTVSEDAAIDDARLDLYSLRPQSIWSLIALIPSMRSGRHGRWESVDLLHGQKMRIVTDEPMRINTDGEVTTRTPAEFRVLPGALSVFVPERYVLDRKEALRAAG